MGHSVPAEGLDPKAFVKGSLSCEDRTGSWPANPHNMPLLGLKGVSTGQSGQKDPPGENGPERESRPQGGLAAGGQSPTVSSPC